MAHAQNLRYAESRPEHLLSVRACICPGGRPKTSYRPAVQWTNKQSAAPSRLRQRHLPIEDPAERRVHHLSLRLASCREKTSYGGGNSLKLGIAAASFCHHIISVQPATNHSSHSCGERMSITLILCLVCRRQQPTMNHLTSRFSQTSAGRSARHGSMKMLRSLHLPEAFSASLRMRSGSFITYS